MTEFVLRPGERLDDLIRDGMKLIQDPREFCYTVDSVLLAQFATLKKDEIVWDLGTGTGVISLLLTSRGARNIEAVEMNPVTADIAKRNVRGNGKDAFIRIHEADYRRYRELFPAGKAGLVVVNPPYGVIGHGAESIAAGRKSARHEINATKEDIMAASNYLLKEGGRLALVLRAERAAAWIRTLEDNFLPVKRLRCVHSFAHSPAKMVLLESRYRGKSGLEILPPLFIYERPGVYTEELLSLYGKEAPA